MRCLILGHKIKDYSPIPVVKARHAHGLLVVRGLEGDCKWCARRIVLTREAIPRWHRHGWAYWWKRVFRRHHDRAD